ncbi:transferrin-binding protein-like solute binding protein [Jannaschia sp. S6380]|uniref:transferrin-binding protein-like solute binding protein n=1 Tax=Jannaschia sp. S6380 TaxID=2926408 RepID=UPI001FF54AF2|nr:transferrin-binding protein-like solute binding protein [Jannaschia sp. S6380]MCK0169133.1 transferrin-binding protein-like solute binding protein [Jannaschia sp. S6380]
MLPTGPRRLASRRQLSPCRVPQDTDRDGAEDGDLHGRQLSANKPGRGAYPRLKKRRNAMKIHVKSAVAILAVAGLSACGGGGGGGDAAGFTDLRDDSVALADRVSSLPLTTRADMPVTGTATYSGGAAFAVDRTLDDVVDSRTGDANLDDDAITAFGDLQMTADFDGGTIRGRIDDLRDRDLGEIDGSIALRDGRINDTEFLVAAEGTIRVEDELEQIDGRIGGEFRGDDAAALRGGGDATIGNSAGTSDLAILIAGEKD